MSASEESKSVDNPQQQQGIDIRQALDILSARSASSSTAHGDHSHSHLHDGAPVQAPCETSATEQGKAMGQTIDLNQQTPLGDDGSSAPTAQDQEMQKMPEELEEVRKARLEEIRTQLQSMTVKELLQAVMEAQRERVATYRHYNHGLEQVLQSGNMVQYPTICTQTTASFAVLSDTINSICAVLDNDKGRHSNLVALIKQLQTQEQEKLNLTAALHLEKIRLHTTQSTEDDPTSGLLQQGIVSLQEKVASCVEAINDVLEEIRYALAEQH